VNSPDGFEFQIWITQSHLGTAVLEVDGKVVLSQMISNDSIFHRDLDIKLNITVPPGSHNISIFNTQPDWYLISNVSLTDYSSQVRCYALQSTQRIMGWIALYNYSWFDILNNYTQPNVTNATVHIENVQNNGPWSLQWWDTRTGTIISTQTVQVNNGQVRIDVPALIPSKNESDWAFKMQYQSSSTLLSPETHHPELTPISIN